MKTEYKLKKRPRHKQALPTACLSCQSKGGYQPTIATDTVEFHNEHFEISYERMACSACGATLLMNEQLKARIKKTVAAYQKKHGLLTAEELIRLRTALGYPKRLTFLKAAPELAEATIKRLEGGQRVQDKSTDLAIRAVMEQLEDKQILDFLNEPMPEAELTSVAQTSASSSNWDFEPLARAACIVTATSISFAVMPKNQSAAGHANEITNTSENVVLC